MLEAFLASTAVRRAPGFNPAVAVRPAYYGRAPCASFTRGSTLCTLRAARPRAAHRDGMQAGHRSVRGLGWMLVSRSGQGTRLRSGQGTRRSRRSRRDGMRTGNTPEWPVSCFFSCRASGAGQRPRIAGAIETRSLSHRDAHVRRTNKPHTPRKRF